MTKEQVVDEKLATLKKAGYRPKFIDGRLVITIDDQMSEDRAVLFRQVWGIEWPIVRSEPWVDTKPATHDQLQFVSHG